MFAVAAVCWCVFLLPDDIFWTKCLLRTCISKKPKIESRKLKLAEMLLPKIKIPKINSRLKLKIESRKLKFRELILA